MAVRPAACQKQVVLTSTNGTVSKKKEGGKYLEQLFLLSFAIK